MRSWSAFPALALAGCSLIFPPPEPHDVFISISPGTVVLPTITYETPPQTVSFTIENTGADTLFVSVVPPLTDPAPAGEGDDAVDTDGEELGVPVVPDAADGTDLVRIFMDPHSTLASGQRDLIQVSIDRRPWRWHTGSYAPALKLSAGYFFSGQEATEPEIPSASEPPTWISETYDLFVQFEIDCDLDDDGADATVCGGTDCRDDVAEVFVGAAETCNGLDDDCDGAIDEDATDQTTWYRDLDADSFGDPDESVFQCFRPSQAWLEDDSDCDDTRSAIRPSAPEVCDGVDNNCNAITDEGCP